MEDIIKKFILGIIVGFLAKLIVTIIEMILDKNIKKGFPNVVNKQRNTTVIKLLKNVVRFIIYFIGIIFILDIFGINTRSLLATAGIGGVALAFGAQSLVEDVIGGMIILLEDTYSVGDFVNIDGVEGTVIELGMRRTVLQNYDMSYISIPNGEILVITNYSRDNTRAEISFPVSHEMGYDKVEDLIKTLKDELRDDENIVEGPILLGIDKLKEFSYEVTITAIVKKGMKYQYMRLFRKRIFEEFNKESYDFSNINVKGEDLSEEI